MCAYCPLGSPIGHDRINAPPPRAWTRIRSVKRTESIGSSTWAFYRSGRNNIGGSCQNLDSSLFAWIRPIAHWVREEGRDVSGGKTSSKPLLLFTSRTHLFDLISYINRNWKHSWKECINFNRIPACNPTYHRFGHPLLSLIARPCFFSIYIRIFSRLFSKLRFLQMFLCHLSNESQPANPAIFDGTRDQ